MAGTWRPLHRGLHPEVLALLDEQRAAGRTPELVHLMLVDDSVTREQSRIACGHGLGEWITGDLDEITCAPCRDAWPLDGCEEAST